MNWDRAFDEAMRLFVLERWRARATPVKAGAPPAPGIHGSARGDRKRATYAEHVQRGVLQTEREFRLTGGGAISLRRARDGRIALRRARRARSNARAAA